MVKDLAQSNHLLKSYGQKTTENQKFLDTDKNCRLSEVFCHNVLTNDWIVLKRSPLVVYFQHHYFKIQQPHIRGNFFVKLYKVSMVAQYCHSVSEGCQMVLGGWQKLPARGQKDSVGKGIVRRCQDVVRMSHGVIRRCQGIEHKTFPTHKILACLQQQEKNS